MKKYETSGVCILKVYVCIASTFWQSMDRSGVVANPGRGQLNRQNYFSPDAVRA